MSFQDSKWRIVFIPMFDNFYDWMLLLVRWLHIVAAISWIGESIFFMWLDRSLEVDPEREGKPG